MRKLPAFIALVACCGTVNAQELARAESWDRDRAAHLLRRAGFGGTPEQIDELAALGLDEAVSRLVDYKAIPQTTPDFASSMIPAPRRILDAVGDIPQDDRKAIRDQLRALNQAELAALRAWWLRRMVVTPRPFEEKMTLFWHGHFTSGAHEVRLTRLMADQNDLLRRCATGSFRTLLSAVCHDPAMLRYLDNAGNRKQHPNENFARELLELYTMGTGNYTEQDIREAARALTGWTFDRSGFRFRRGWHDFGKKTFLGREGGFDGDDIVDIILSRPETARHIARRLLVYFVCDSPPEPFVDAVSEKLRDTDYDTRECMRAVFTSEAFYAQCYRFEHVKSPVELVVSTLRTLGLRDCDYYGATGLVRSMGQDLFQPPNVKGWDGGRAWISSSTLFARQRFAAALVAGGPAKPFEMRQKRWNEVAGIRDSLREALPPRVPLAFATPQVGLMRQPPLDVPRLLGDAKPRTVGQVVDRLALALLQHPLEPSQRTQLIKLLGNESDVVDADEPHLRRRVGAVIRAIMELPEFQLS